MSFLKKIYDSAVAQGRAEGKEEGKAEGIAKGIVDGKAQGMAIGARSFRTTENIQPQLCCSRRAAW